MENKEPINPEDMARIDQALEELSCWKLPQVWLSDSNRDANEKAVGTKVDWFPLYRVLGTDLAPRFVQVDLFEETAYVLAAKSGLVAVKKILPLHGLTLAERSLIASLKKPGYQIIEGFYHGMFDLGSGPPSEDWVQKGTVMLFEFPPDEYLTVASAEMIRFVARDALTSAHVPYVKDYLYRVIDGPREYTVEATDEVEFVLDVLRGMEGI